MDKERNRSGDITLSLLLVLFVGLKLLVLFVGLKLTGNIDWSWWWVLSPVWIPIAFVLAIVAVGGFVFLLKEVVLKK